jgi:hypothetical protein
LNVSARRYTNAGRINQKVIISVTHKNEPTRKAIAVILESAYNVKDNKAKTFTSINMSLISGRLIK